MPVSWSESNRLHSTRMREDAAMSELVDSLLFVEDEEIADSDAFISPEEFHHSERLTAEDHYEMRELARFDAMHDGDLDFDPDLDGSFDDHAEDRYLDSSYEDRTELMEVEF